MIHGIRFIDGELLTGATWEDVERAWSRRGMNSLTTDFRAEIQDQAKLWSGVEIATDGSSLDFLQECERAGLLIIVLDATYAREQPQAFDSMPRLVHLHRLRELAERREQSKQQRANRV